MWIKPLFEIMATLPTIASASTKKTRIYTVHNTIEYPLIYRMLFFRRKKIFLLFWIAYLKAEN